MLAPTSHSDRMGRVRRAGTTPEARLLEALRALGVVPLDRSDLPRGAGQPDFILPGPMAVFVDGCFWHGCPWHYSAPRSRETFWAAKLRANVERDRAHTVALERAGWTVARVWEHEVRAGAEEVAAKLGRNHRPLGGRERDWRVVRVETIRDVGLEVRFLESFTGEPEAATWRTTRRTSSSRVLPLLVAEGVVAEAS